MILKQLPGWFGLAHGCDPELFVSRTAGLIRKRKAIVGSEIVIPPEGIKVGGWGEIVRDGVQIELHPKPSTCRESLSYYIQQCFITLNDQVNIAAGRLKQPLIIDFTPVVSLSRGDLAKLTPESQRLGCIPSKNIYGKEHIEKDGTKYLTRSAAGHLHFGSTSLINGKLDPIGLVKACDVLIGNTMVMLDRDPNAALRRKVYGRAGEYRTPTHGLEYRTLSNFWLHSYQLMSFVFAMARMAFSVVGAKYPPSKSDYYANPMLDAEEQLMKNVDLRKIEQAINTNDYELARSNYENMVKPFLAQITTNYGIGANQLGQFDFFLDQIRRADLEGHPQPLSIWFPADPLKAWMNKGPIGWENFLAQQVHSEMRKKTTISGLVEVPVQVTEPTIPASGYIPEDAPFQGQSIGGGTIRG